MEKKVKLKNWQLAMMMVALCLGTMAMMADMIVIPVAEVMYTVYDDVNAVSYILSGPALINAVICAFAGKIIEKIGARRFLIIGFGVFMISGVLTVVSQDLIMLLVSRTLQGFGMAAMAVCGVVVISQHFIDKKKRSSMIGVFNGVMAIMGAAMGMLAGFLASIEWTYVFYIYLAAIPIFILLFIFVPKDDESNDEEEELDETGKSASTKMPWGIVTRVALAFFAFNLLYCVVYYQVSVISVEKGMDNMAFIGLLSALGTIGSFLANILFGLYFPRTKRFTITIAYVIVTAFFFVLFFANSEFTIALSCTFLGVAYGINMSYYYSYATMVVPRARIPMSTAIVAFAAGVAMFLASYLPFWIMAITGIETITGTIVPIAIASAIGTVLSVFFGIRERKYLENM